MTDRERELLEALVQEDGFRSIPMLQYHHPGLKVYTPRQLSYSAAGLVREGLAVRTVASLEREAKYKITYEGSSLIRAEATKPAAIDPASAKPAAVSDEKR